LKTLIKYDLDVKFPRIFAHNVQICDKYTVVKIPMMFVKYFEYYTTILRGPFFRGHAVYNLSKICVTEMKSWVRH